MDAQETGNYKLLNKLLKDHGTGALYGIFRVRYLMLTGTGTRWEDGSQAAKEFFTPHLKSKIFLPNQCKLLRTGDARNFDLDLLTTLIPNMDLGSFKTPRFSMIQDQLRAQNLYISELEELVSKIKKLPGKVEGKHFEELWDHLEEVLYKLGVPGECFDEVLQPTEEDAMQNKKGVQESQNYQRLCNLIIGQGSDALRIIFGSRYMLINWGQYFDDGSSAAKEFLRRLMKSEKLPPMQRKMLETGDTERFDVSLLCKVIPMMQCPPERSLVREEVNYQTFKVRQLGILRNTFAHLPGNTLDDRRFEELWGRARRILLKLGVYEEEIDEIYKGSSPDSENSASVQTSEVTAIDRCQIVEEGQLTVQELIEAGISSMKKGDYQDAIAYYSTALSSNSLSNDDRLLVQTKRSDACMKALSQNNNHLPQENIDRYCLLALEDAEDMMKTDPAFWKGYLLAGQVNQFKQEWKTALDLLSQALKLNPGLQDVEQRIVECRRNLKKQKSKERRQKHE